MQFLILTKLEYQAGLIKEQSISGLLRLYNTSYTKSTS